jgi:nucleoid-associated protein YgaU
MHGRPILAPLLLVSALAACVPQPPGRVPSSEPGAALGTPAPTAVPTPPGPTPTLSFIRPTPTPEPTFAVYTVKRGDTLVGIARRFKTSGRSIAYWNRVAYPSLDPDSPKYKPDRLELGWVLQLLPGQEVDPENLPTLTPKPTPTPKPGASSAAPTESPPG